MSILKKPATLSISSNSKSSSPTTKEEKKYGGDPLIPYVKFACEDVEDCTNLGLVNRLISIDTLAKDHSKVPPCKGCDVSSCYAGCVIDGVMAHDLAKEKKELAKLEKLTNAEIARRKKITTEEKKVKDAALRQQRAEERRLQREERQKQWDDWKTNQWPKHRESLVKAGKVAASVAGFFGKWIKKGAEKGTSAFVDSLNLEQEQPFRTWTSADGKHTIEGRLIGISETAVRLQKPDGSLVDVQKSQLSPSDQAAIAGTK